MRQSRGYSLLPLLCLSGLPGMAAADIVSPSAPVSISQTFSYASYGGGDFVFSTTQGATGCESGWYVKASDPGYKSVVATVLAAQSGGSQVIVYGDNSDLWPGSPSGHFCRIQSVGISS
jgi:hypothetical protein